MLNRTLHLCLLTTLSLGLFAQQGPAAGNVPFDKEHIPEGAALKQALSDIKKADALAAKGGLDQVAAIEAYQKALRVNPDNAEVNMKLGVAMLNGPQPAEALPVLQHAAMLDPQMPRIHFLLAYALQLNAQWDKAIAEYQVQGKIIRTTPDPDRMFNLVDKHITECKYGKAYMAAPVHAQVINAGPAVNTAGSEYGALLGPKGELLFTSRRPNTTGGKVNKVVNSWFEDIYASDWGANGWSTPEPLPKPVNGNRNDATVSMRADGSGMIIYRDEQGGGDLYACQHEGDGWSAPVALPPTVNTPDQESSAWVTADGNWLYFVSSREGGLGGSDIYRSQWDFATANWGEARNLGPDINTPYDEDGVFLPAGGKTLYFASRGHSTMGGYDLFKSTLGPDGWSRPENLGWPINSPGDDQFLVLNADGATGYMNSVRPGGMGEDDIYRVDFQKGPAADQTAMLVSMESGVPLTPKQKQLRLVGFIKGLKMMAPVEAKVEVMDLDDPSFNLSISTDPATGEFTASVPAGRDYAVHVTANGYLLHSEHLDEKNGAGVKRMDVGLKAAKSGSAEVLANVRFDEGGSHLEPSSVVDLKQLVRFLVMNPDIKIEVAGHTDSEPGPISNQELSELRAKAVADWLTSHGIAPERSVAKGYGDTEPVAPNDSPEHRALNRRTEVRIL